MHRQPELAAPSPKRKVLRRAGVRHLYKWNLKPLPTRGKEGGRESRPGHAVTLCGEILVQGCSRVSSHLADGPGKQWRDYMLAQWHDARGDVEANATLAVLQRSTIQTRYNAMPQSPELKDCSDVMLCPLPRSKPRYLNMLNEQLQKLLRRPPL